MSNISNLGDAYNWSVAKIAEAFGRTGSLEDFTLALVGVDVVHCRTGSNRKPCGLTTRNNL